MPLLHVEWIERSCVSRTTKDEERTADDKCLCCRPTYVGHMILLCGKKESHFPFQCMVGPDWPCMVITYTLVIVPSIIFLVLVAAQIHWLAMLLGIISSCVVLVFFSLTACSDPGIVFRNPGQRSSINGEEGEVEAPEDPATHIPCSRCEITRPIGASHCYDCEVCVEELDHHCPWTGKCIGKKNLKFFYLFLAALTIHILYVGIVTGMHAINSAFKLDAP